MNTDLQKVKNNSSRFTNNTFRDDQNRKLGLRICLRKFAPNQCPQNKNSKFLSLRQKKNKKVSGQSGLHKVEIFVSSK